MSFDSKNNIKAVVALNIQAISSDTTTAGSSIDLTGFNSATFAIQSGTLTDGTYTPVISDSDDGSTFTAVADDFLIGTEAEAAFAATDDNAIKTIGYVGGKQYVKLSIVSASTSSGGTIGAQALLGHSSHAPVTQ